VWSAIASRFTIATWLSSSDITDGNVHLDVRWLDQFTCRYSPLHRPVDWSSRHTARWTFPLVMSLDGSHMAIVKRLAMADHTHTWRHNNMSPLMNAIVDGQPCFPTDDTQITVLRSYSTFNCWHSGHGHPRGVWAYPLGAQRAHGAASAGADVGADAATPVQTLVLAVSWGITDNTGMSLTKRVLFYNITIVSYCLISCICLYFSFLLLFFAVNPRCW